jgi:hypothetical protein
MKSLVVVMAALAIAACESSEPMRSLSDPCVGEKVVVARNSSKRPVELYARRDTTAARLVGVVPPEGSGEYPVPPDATGVFVFPFAGDGAPESAGRVPQISLSYKCVTGRPRPGDSRA